LQTRSAKFDFNIEITLTDSKNSQISQTSSYSTHILNLIEIKIFMKCALIICPYLTNGGYPPLGVAYLNSVLKSNKYDVDVFDFQFLFQYENHKLYNLLKKLVNIASGETQVTFITNPEFVAYSLFSAEYPDFDWQITENEEYRDECIYLHSELKSYVNRYAKMVLKENPDIVFFSTYISNILFSLMLAKELKRRHPEIPVIFGGPGSALKETAEFILSLKFVNGVIIGEGEETVIELLTEFKKTKKINPKIMGLATLSGRQLKYKSRPLIKNLDGIPYPDFDGFPLKNFTLKYYQKNWKYELRSLFFDRFLLPVQSSRGCIMRCKFCSESAFWHSFRTRNVKSLANEIEFQVGKYDINNISFNSSLLNSDKKWYENFLDSLEKQRVNIKWWSYLRPSEDLSKDVVKKMVSSGCEFVSIGVESFSQKVLNKMGKETRAKKIFEILKCLNDAKIYVDITLLTGFPVKSDEIEENLRFLKKWKRYIENKKNYVFINAWGLLRLEPQSRIFHNYEGFGIKIHRNPIRIPKEMSFLGLSLSKISLTWETPYETLEEKYQKRDTMINYIKNDLPQCLLHHRFGVKRFREVVGME